MLVVEKNVFDKVRKWINNNDQIFVAFSGAAYAGKTTLVNELEKILSKQGFKVATVTNCAREVLKKYGKCIDDVRTPEKFMDFQLDLLEYRYNKEMEAKESDADIVLSDRTIFDQYAYVLQYSHLYDEDQFSEYVCQFDKFLTDTDYSILIFTYSLPIDEKYNDGIRSNKASPRQCYEEILRGLYARYCYKCDIYSELEVMPVDDRIWRVLQTLEYYVSGWWRF